MKSKVPSGTNAGRGKRRQPEEKASKRGRKVHRKTQSSQAGPSQAGPAHSRSAGVAARGLWRVEAGHAGDHPSAFHFLIGIFQRPSAVEFQAQLDEPSYEPSDRLFVKDGSRVISHLRMCQRQLKFSEVELPVCQIADVATLREFRNRKCASALLYEARKQMVSDGAVLGLLRTDQHRFYQDRGWVVCGRHAYSTAHPQSIRSYLRRCESELSESDTTVLNRRTPPAYNIRLWRHVEQAALMRLYRERTDSMCGPLRRSEAYWRWLVGRNGNLRIYVAINGPSRIDLAEPLDPIVGYAVACDGRIVELMCSSEHPEARRQLLVRACGDAQELGFHEIRLDAPAGDPLHQVLVAAGGKCCHHEADKGMVFMADIPKPGSFFKRLSRVFYQRARQAGLPCPYELGFLVGEERYRLKISRRALQWLPAKLGRSYIACRPYALTQLMLGHLDVDEAIKDGRVIPSTRVARTALSALFPRVNLWYPPWDELPAM